MKKFILIASIILFLSTNGLGWSYAVMGQEKPDSADLVVFTILYNNTSADDSILADHGFSCLIESGNHSCLLDAGRIPDKFMTNVSQLGVNCSRINSVFISHIHGDHMGGIFDVLAKCVQPVLYLPFSYPQTPDEPHTDKSDSDFLALLKQLKPFVSEIARKKESFKISDPFYSTGMMEDQTYEQALIVSTARGLIIIAGCAHPGILNIVKRAKELMKQDVHFVMGGFHLVSTDSAQVQTIARELRKLTKYVGPCHCTGEIAQGIFKDVFKEDYIDIRAGLKLKFGDGQFRSACPERGDDHAAAEPGSDGERHPENIPQPSQLDDEVWQPVGAPIFPCEAAEAIPRRQRHGSGINRSSSPE